MRAVRKCCKHNADGRRRERLCDVLRPFEHNKIPRILQELVEAERREIATLLETIRINVYEPRELGGSTSKLARQEVNLLEDKGRTIYCFFDAERFCH